MPQITFPSMYTARIEHRGVSWKVPLMMSEVNGLYAGADHLVRASILGRVSIPTNDEISAAESAARDQLAAFDRDRTRI